MTTVTDIRQLIIRVVDKLSQGGPTALDRDLADEYASLCVNINARLAQCARMIDEGSSMHALMLAEEKPNLLDAVASVSFAKAAEWQEACALNALRQPPKIDRSAVHKLNDIYTRGNKSDQTSALYNTFRAAMAARKDGEALDSIRAINRLDPSDTNAAQQLARLEKKRREDCVKALGAALSAAAEQDILKWLDQCERLEVTDAAEVSRAKAVRESVRAREAKQEIEQIVPCLRALEEEGKWQHCGERAARVNSLTATYRLQISVEDAATVTRATAYFESCRKEAIKSAQFKDSVAAISEWADKIQGAPQGGSKLTLDVLEEQRLSLRKAYDKAREFLMPIPDQLVDRVTRLAENLDTEIERRRKARKVRHLVLAGSAVVFLAATVAGGYYYIRASQLAAEALALKQEGKAITLRKLVEQLRGEQSLYASVPSLKSALLESESWLQGVAAQEQAARGAVEQAAALAASGFDNQTPEQAVSFFKQANDAISKLPPDLADVLRPELVEPEGKLAIWIGGMRDGRVAGAREQIEEARQQAQTLAAADSAEQVRQALQPLAESVRVLLRLADTPVEDMKLPETMKAEVMDLAAKVDQAANSLSSYDAALERVSSASNVAEYVSGVSKLSEVPLPRAPMVKAAQLISAKNLKEHDLLGAMILPNEPAVWSASATAGYWESDPRPAEPLPNEIKVLRDLINNDNLVGIHIVTIQKLDSLSGQSAKRRVYTRGRLTRSEPTKSSITARGMVYDPAVSGSRVSFEEKVFAFHKSPTVGTEHGERIDTENESDVSESFEKINVQQLVNSSGTKYERGILESFDQVKNAPQMPALAKAYIFQELAKIAELQPIKWGLAWSPSFKLDSVELREASKGEVSSGDWMVPSKSNLNASLSEWFKGKGALSYVAEQAVNRKLAQAAVEAGLRVYGYVGENGQFVVTRPADLEAVDELWGLEIGTTTPRILYVRDNESAEASFVSVAKGATLSPLFASPMDKPRVLEAALRSAGISDRAAGAYQRSLPPLFAPRTSPQPSQ